VGRHQEGLVPAPQRRLVSTGSKFRIRRRRRRRCIVGGWGCRETPPVCISMLLTIKELAEQLRIKPSTLYAWAAQGKIPCRKIHGLVRFDPIEIDRWLISFSPSQSAPPQIETHRAEHTDLEQLIASAKREVYTSAHGETITPSPTGKE
jgi:excisionase family DNA binding protein